MRSILLPVAVLGFVACASAPPGPTDAEVRATLEASVDAMEREILAGNSAAVAQRFASDGRLVLANVAGPNGMMNETIVGVPQVQAFMSSIGAPPQYQMTATEFARTGDTATQTGTWSVDGGAAGGSFILEWRRMDDGGWRIASWRLQGN